METTRTLDLHQKTVVRALADFMAFYNGCVRQGFRGRLEVIHGYGSSGVGGGIKQALREFLDAHAASFQRVVYAPGNPGMTVVYPKAEIGEGPPKPDGKIRRITPLVPTRKASNSAASSRKLNGPR